ncbi:MAG: hypothetical protein ACLSD6_04280 [Clostridium sp.]
MKDFLKNKQKWIVGLVILGLMFVAGGFGVYLIYMEIGVTVAMK